MKKQITLIASDGCWITQVSCPDEDRFFTKVITLPTPSMANDWDEWTDDEKTAWEEAHEEPNE